jgi:hypothetical protein
MHVPPSGSRYVASAGPSFEDDGPTNEVTPVLAAVTDPASIDPSVDPLSAEDALDRRLDDDELVTAPPDAT